MTDEMNKVNRVGADPDERVYDPMLDSVLRPALKDFRASVHAWSEAAYNRPRPVPASAPQKIAGRRAAAWVLTLALSVGVVGTAGYEHHRRGVIAQQKQHEQEMERQRVLAEQQARETEELMANIDSDVSRQVPAAMEPLALTADGTQ
jgi:uncharacterized protein HemX